MEITVSINVHIVSITNVTDLMGVVFMVVKMERHANQVQLPVQCFVIIIDFLTHFVHFFNEF